MCQPPTLSPTLTQEGTRRVTLKILTVHTRGTDLPVSMKDWAERKIHFYSAINPEGLRNIVNAAPRGV